MKDFFDKEGKLSRLIENYSVREYQAVMAEKIAQTIEEGDTLVVEAPTGIGKTFAYLLPVFHLKKKAIISTATIVLQHQLFEKDIPLLCELFDRNTKVEILKGRQNYICLQRYFNEKNRDNPQSEREIYRIVGEWLRYTDTGDFAEIEGISVSDYSIRKINADKNFCTGKKCPHFKECFFYKARKRCESADIILVNHHLFVSDLAVKQSDFGNILPPADVVIIDEAHRFESIASMQFGDTFSLKMLAIFFNQLPSLLRLKYAGDFDYLLDRNNWEGKNFQCGKLTLSQIENFEKLKTIIEKLVNDLEVLDSKEFELKENMIKRAQRFVSFVNTIGDKDFVTFCRIENKSFVFMQIPLDVSVKLSNLFSVYYPCAVFTSATLSVNGSLDFFKKSIGLDYAEETVLPSLFDYKKNTIMFVPTNIPYVNEEGFIEKSVDLIDGILKKLKGKTFILCTSLKNVQKFSSALKLSGKFNVLTQGEESNASLLERFRLEDNSVLIGSLSFWEGVDIRGEDLSCVIIDRLPFNRPDDPVFEEKSKRIESSFKNYAIPLAVLQLKQGLGRLIRDESDRGIFVILDKRIKTKWYGKFFIKSLFNTNITENIEDVYRFIDKVIRKE